MYLSRVEFEGDHDSFDLNLQPGLNVIVVTSQLREQQLLENLVSALSFDTQASEFEPSRMRIEFVQGGTQRYCCDLSAERQPIFYQVSQDSSRPDLASISPDSKETQFPALAPALWKAIAGVKRNQLATSRDTPTITSETIKAWEYERNSLQQTYNQLKDLELQFDSLKPDLELTNRIAQLPGELKQRLDNVPSLREQFQSRVNQISGAKEDVFLTEAADRNINLDPKIAYAFGGMLLSFVVAELVDFPMIALLNLFFAVFIVTRLFQAIEQLENSARVKARSRAVTGAELRVAKKRAQTSSELESLATALGTDETSLERVMSTSKEIVHHAEQLKKEIEVLGQGASSEDILEELNILSEKIAKGHNQVLNQEAASATKQSLEVNDPERLDRTLFFELTQTETASVSRDEFEEQVLASLRTLSEGRYDGATLSEEGRLTVVGPDDVFPVSFTKFGDTDKELIETAVRFGAIQAILQTDKILPFALTDKFARQSKTRRVRFREAIDEFVKQTQIIVVSSTKDWPNANVVIP